jgi:hypothetical protein
MGKENLDPMEKALWFNEIKVCWVNLVLKNKKKEFMKVRKKC